MSEFSERRIADLEARLSAVEAERNNALDREERTALQLIAQGEATRAAEARVKALTAAAERFRAAIDAPSHDGWLTELNAAEVALDAALAAPVPETRQP